MELQIQDLVSSIKKEGIDAANAEAARILSEARAKADAIVASAKAEAQAEKESAEKESARFRENARLGAEQAKRDAMLSFKEEVRDAFRKILAARVRESLSDETLVKLILAALQGENAGDYALETARVSDALRSSLAEKIEEGLEIRPTKTVSAGFRLAAKDGSGYFDCSDEEIMRMLMPYFRNLDF